MEREEIRKMLEIEEARRREEHVCKQMEGGRREEGGNEKMEKKE